jgi:dephospho-CoA kinase
MQTIGITGGIGMGKSTVARSLGEKGYPVIDTDQIAREIVAPGTPAFTEITEHFGPEIVDSSGTIHRAALAQRVFRDPAQLDALNRITHPRIRQSWLSQLEEYRRQDAYSLVFVMIPLLFEIGVEGGFDHILCVACSTAEQKRRLSERGWDPDHQSHRIQSQWPISRKITQSHFLVWCEGSHECVLSQLERVQAHILQKPAA